jgi:hypothetical protein
MMINLVRYDAGKKGLRENALFWRQTKQTVLSAELRLFLSANFVAVVHSLVSTWFDWILEDESESMDW